MVPNLLEFVPHCLRSSLLTRLVKLVFLADELEQIQREVWDVVCTFDLPSRNDVRHSGDELTVPVRPCRIHWSG